MKKSFGAVNVEIRIAIICVIGRRILRGRGKKITQAKKAETEKCTAVIGINY